MNGMGAPAIAIFDWDGVIIDSHDQHERSWGMLAEREGSQLFGHRRQPGVDVHGFGADRGAHPQESEALVRG